MGSEKYIENISMSSAEKRYKPAKHYVYVLQVTWSDGSTFPVFRRYSEFYDFHNELIELFPKAAGFGGNRVIPYLPGKKLIRSRVEKVAAKRKGPLEEYCRGLIKLDHAISRHELVMDFFRTRPEDINPPKDALKKPDKSKLFAALGLIVPKFLKKDKDRLGLIDNTSADDLYVSGPVNFDTYYAIADYASQARGEITLEEGQEVEVVEKNENGWWFVSFGTEQGWAPASFLEPVNTAHELDDPEPLYNGETYFTIEAYEAELEDEISFPKGVIVEAIHKLLDGWWIISYDGKVGHAPATYLQEYSNPHFSPTALKNFKPKKVRPPTQRRCTIKNRHSKWRDSTSPEKKDMAMYRKLSVKIATNRKKGRPTDKNKPPLPPGRPKAPSLVEEEEEDELYVNNEEAVTLATRANSNKKPFPKPRGRKSPVGDSSDGELPDYDSIDERKMEGAKMRPSSSYENLSEISSGDDEQYINVPSPYSSEKSRDRKSPPEEVSRKPGPDNRVPVNKMSDTDKSLLSMSVPIAQSRSCDKGKDNNKAKAKPVAAARKSPPSGAKTDKTVGGKDLQPTPLVQATEVKQKPNWKPKPAKTNLHPSTPPSAKTHKQEDKPQLKTVPGGILAQRLAQFGN